MKQPRLTVDIIIEYQDGIVLIERKNYPYGWAIPGGFVEYGETVENCAIREAKEETSLEIKEVKQFHVYSEPERDPRGHTVTVVFTAKGYGELRPSSDAKSAKIFNENNLPENIAFDHRKILEDYFLQKVKINHIGIAVRNINESKDRWEILLSQKFTQPIKVDTQKVNVSFAKLYENEIELVEPAEIGSPIDNFLSRRGEGLHHICFSVKNINKVIKLLKEKGAKLIDDEPKIGIYGKKIAFVHPSSFNGVLIELVEE